MNEYADNVSSTLKRAGIVEKVENDGKNNSLKEEEDYFLCDICYEEIPKKDVIKLECEHVYCRECLKTYGHSQILQGQGCIRISCPTSGCNVSIFPSLIMDLIDGKK